MINDCYLKIEPVSISEALDGQLCIVDYSEVEDDLAEDIMVYSVMVAKNKKTRYYLVSLDEIHGRTEVKADFKIRLIPLP